VCGRCPIVATAKDGANKFVAPERLLQRLIRPKLDRHAEEIGRTISRIRE